METIISCIFILVVMLPNFIYFCSKIDFKSVLRSFISLSRNLKASLSKSIQVIPFFRITLIQETQIEGQKWMFYQSKNSFGAIFNLVDVLYHKSINFQKVDTILSKLKSPYVFVIS